MDRDDVVIRMRLERMTVCLEGRCSIQLSYRTDFLRMTKLDSFLILCKCELLICGNRLVYRRVMLRFRLSVLRRAPDGCGRGW